MIARRVLSPTDLLESCLARIAAINPAVNAFVALDVEGARAAAREAEGAVMRGSDLPLLGLPIGVKDLEDARGLPTVQGSPTCRGHVAAHDQASVAGLRAAGAIVLGKTNVPEFGAGANTVNDVFGATGNPFDPRLSAAGSSGGSAVALACGMVPLATGSDTGGSLRNPAAFCGVVGMRPSAGLVPSERRVLGWMGLASSGPMGRTVGDVALMLSVMAQHDGRDPLSRPGGLGPVPQVELRSVRAAVSADLGFCAVEPGVRDAFAAVAAGVSGLVASVEEDAPDCAGADDAFAVLRGVGFVAQHGWRDGVGPLVRANIEEGRRYTVADVARAEAARTAMFRAWAGFFERYDVLLTPAVAVSPRPWTEAYPAEIDGRAMGSYYQWLGLAYAATLVGHPALSLPVGRDARGMPFGLQIVGARGADAQVLGVAAALERAWAHDPLRARPLPDVARLRAAPAIWAGERR